RNAAAGLRRLPSTGWMRASALPSSIRCARCSRRTASPSSARDRPRNPHAFCANDIGPKRRETMKQWKGSDVMTTPVVSVREDTPYAEIVGTLARHKISAVPVQDSFGRVLGVVSEADLLHKVEFIGDEPRVFEWGSRKAN